MESGKVSETCDEIRTVLCWVDRAPLRKRPRSIISTYRPDRMRVTYFRQIGGEWTALRAELRGPHTTINGHETGGTCVEKFRPPKALRRLPDEYQQIIGTHRPKER